MANNAEVLTTIQITGSPKWSATDMTKDGSPVTLIQNDDLNIGILGRAPDIRIMCDRIKALLP